MGYTASDLLSVGIGFALFGLFAFAPGYTFGWLSNVFQFRRRRLATRLAAAVPMSLGLTPIAVYFFWRWWLPLVWILYGICTAACAILLAGDLRANKLQLSRAGWRVMAIAIGWLAIGTLSLIDLQFGNRLYFPTAAHDYVTRVPFVAALARDGIPPHNPFFFAGRPAPLRYHYFWLIPCALVDKLGGSLVSARIAVIAGTLWTGLGFLALVALYLRFFQGKRGDQIERRTLIAVALLGVTGLDILPALIIDASGHVILPSIVWWIASWVNTVLWVPHDLAGLIAGLTGFLLTWDAARQGRRHETIVALVAGGLCFASAVGSSIYVGATLAVGCALWLAIALLKRWWRHAWVLASAGMLAGALLLPFLFEVGRGLQRASYTALFSFTVRGFWLVPTANHGKWLVLNAALLPLNYFFEFGFFSVVACLAVRRIWRHGFGDHAGYCAAVLGAASLFICTFASSGVIANNDLAWRSPLVVQFILVLWAAEMWNEGVLGFGPPRAVAATAAPRARSAHYLVAITLVLGVLGSCYELCLQRVYPILADSFPIERVSWLSQDRQLGRQTFELRRAYEELDRMLPATAVVQHDPEAGIGNIPAGLYSDRQMVAAGGSCSTIFGGSKNFCDKVILPRLKPLFDDRDPVTPGEVAGVCRQFSITALLFKDTDPVWRDKSSWIWRARPLLSNDFVRVIECGASGTQAHDDTRH